jgi:hypothetical protein
LLALKGADLYGNDNSQFCTYPFDVYSHHYTVMHYVFMKLYLLSPSYAVVTEGKFQGHYFIGNSHHSSLRPVCVMTGNVASIRFLCNNSYFVTLVWWSNLTDLPKQV